MKRIQAAIEHVRQFHPEVSTVHFDYTGRWLYSDGKGNAPTFTQVDVSILEDAEYNIDHLPATYDYRDGQLIGREE